MQSKPKPGVSAANVARESWRATVGHQTGARTAEGRARSAARSRKSGAHGYDAKALRAYLRTVRELAKIVQAK